VILFFWHLPFVLLWVETFFPQGPFVSPPWRFVRVSPLGFVGHSALSRCGFLFPPLPRMRGWFRRFRGWGGGAPGKPLSFCRLVIFLCFSRLRLRHETPLQAPVCRSLSPLFFCPWCVAVGCFPPSEGLMLFCFAFFFWLPFREPFVLALELILFGVLPCFPSPLDRFCRFPFPL